MDSSDSPERTAYGQELQAAIESPVNAPPPMYRSVFVLREVEELSVAETADCLGITKESVNTRCHRARALLRNRWNARSAMPPLRRSRISGIDATA